MHADITFSASSANSGIAAVTETEETVNDHAKYRVDAVSAGTTTISVTATQGSVTKSAILNVTVVDAVPTATPVITPTATPVPDKLTGLALSTGAIVLDLADPTPSEEVPFAVTSTGSPEIHVTAVSSNEAVATFGMTTDLFPPIDRFTVTPHAKGNATITLTATDGTTSRQVQLAVAVVDSTATPAPTDPSSVTLSSDTLQIDLSVSDTTKDANVNYVIAPESVTVAASDMIVTSSNPGVATADVNAAGVLTVTGLSAGTSTITLMTPNGKSDQLVVTVTKATTSVVRPTGIAFDTGHGRTN